MINRHPPRTVRESPGLDTTLTAVLFCRPCRASVKELRRWRAEQIARGGRVIGGIWQYPGDEDYEYNAFDRRLEAIMYQVCFETLPPTERKK